MAIMKKLILLLVVISLMGSLTSCMRLRAASAQFNIQTTQGHLDAFPVKSPVYKQVQSVVVADFSPRLGSEYSSDNKRLYKAAILELESLLRKNSSFHVVSASVFKDRLLEINAVEHLSILTEEELHEELARVGKSLGAHGVITIGFNADGATNLGNQFKYMGQLVVKGAISIPMTASLDVVRSRTAETVWSQESSVAVTTGTNGTKNTPIKDIRQHLRTVLEPLVRQAIENHRS